MENTTETTLWAARILDYMRQHKYNVSTTVGEINIVYLEGINPDFSENADALDGWNDLSLLISHLADGTPVLLHSAVCTTEPGKAATFSSAARRLGGVARIKFGQHTAWRMGYHQFAKRNKQHPALVQCAAIPVHRDSNRDGKRTGDLVNYGYGINQHSTFPGYTGSKIGNWSAGCLVRRWWVDHLAWIGILQQDARYLKNKKFVFSSTIIAGDDFLDHEVVRLFAIPPHLLY